MPRKTTDNGPAGTPNVSQDIVEGMTEVLAHHRGEIQLEQVWPKPIDVRAIRKQVKMSQAKFAAAYQISKRAIQEWEQGGRQPDSAALQRSFHEAFQHGLVSPLRRGSKLQTSAIAAPVTDAVTP